MARAMASQALSQDMGATLVQQTYGNFEDSWPEEPTQVDAAMTMEELILAELSSPGALPAPANDPKKGTLLR